MPTPLFKVLANSIRLGQPPEAVTAIKALVEVIAHQENELNDLRQRISLLSSRLQFLEAKTSRIEVASLHSGPPSAPSPYASDQIVMPQREPLPQALSVPHHLPKADPLPSRVERPRSQMPPPMSPPFASGRFGDERREDDSQDEASGTLVVSRADIDSVVKQVVENEAPFPLPPPGGHRPLEHHADMPFKPATASGPQSEPEDEPRRGRVDPSRGDSARVDAGRAAKAPDPGRGSISDPYVAIELGVEDTFSSTAEVAAAQAPPEKAPAPRRPLIVDEPSFDEVLTSVHKRKP